MKTKILLAFCCLLTITSFSQDSIFQLKDYKYRTKGYTALDFSTSFSGGVSDRKNINDTSKSRSFQLFPTTINLRRIISSDKRFFTSTLSFSPSCSFSSEERNIIKNKSNNGWLYSDWQFDNRSFKKNNWFLQLDNKLNVNGNTFKQSSESVINKYNRLEVTDELTLGFGKGRIEMVQDAQMALFILNDLKEQGLIDHSLNAETVNHFAQLITSINNKRIFDFRRKRIYELTQIESFLKENGITNSTDIRHFTTINDNWALAYNPLRSSGSNWFIHIMPSANIANYKTVNDIASATIILKTNNKKLGIAPELGYENYKPINLKWQRNLGSVFSWYHYKTISNNKTTNGSGIYENNTSYYSNEAWLRLFYSLDFYPSNRTRVNSSFNLTTVYYPYNNSVSKDAISVRPFINLGTDYFLSYRTRLSAYLTFDYRYDRFNNVMLPVTKTHLLNSYCSMSITHSFL